MWYPIASINYQQEIMGNSKLKFNKNNSGFTLIELIIVLAILGILAVIALQSMSSDNISKAQMTEGLNLANSMKTANNQYFAKHGDFPDNTAGAVGEVPIATDISGEYVKQTSTKDNKILIEFKSKAENPSVTADIASKKILLTGISSGVSMRWECTTEISDDISPTSCTGDQSGLSLD